MNLPAGFLLVVLTRLAYEKKPTLRCGTLGSDEFYPVCSADKGCANDLHSSLPVCVTFDSDSAVFPARFAVLALAIAPGMRGTFF